MRPQVCQVKSLTPPSMYPPPPSKKVIRKVQGMPQSQTVANPRHQEEEKNDKHIHARKKRLGNEILYL